MDAVVAIYSFLIGAVTGSFLGAAWYRIPKKESLRGRSACPSCGEQIQNRYNIPVFSWIILKGKSKCCGTKISWHYPLFETIVALIFVAAGLSIGLVGAFILAFSVIGIVFVASEIRARQS